MSTTSEQQDLPPTEKAGDPSVFLSDILGGPIVVKLNSGVEYRGTFCSVLWVGV